MRPLIPDGFVMQCNNITVDLLLQRPYGGGNQYSYSNWSPPTQSNDSTNGYFLERSNSARKLLERALELCPQEVHFLCTYISKSILHSLDTFWQFLFNL